MIMELIKTMLIVVPCGLVGIILISKLVDFMMNQMMHSNRLNRQLQMLLKEEQEMNDK